MAVKLRTLEQLRRLIDHRERPAGRKVALCHGVFDLVTFVHLEHFKFAKSLADILVVSLTPDVAIRKGPGRPIFPAEIRAKNLEAISHIDYLCFNDRLDATDIIAAIRPDFYVKGMDYYSKKKDAKLSRERKAVTSYGGIIVFGPNVLEFHTSDVVAIARGETTYADVLKERHAKAQPE